MDGVCDAQKKHGSNPRRILNYKGPLITAVIPAVSTVSAIATPTAILPTTATATATISPFFTRTRFVNGQTSSLKLLLIEHLDRLLDIVRRAHIDKTETTWTPGFAIINQVDTNDAPGLGKMLDQLIFRHGEGDITDIQTIGHSNWQI